ncbi:light-regulated signal transduction histidine kinase (bacteriophytochrome) [Mucilaginibacter yixingensis]|uniref:histidine kinase n=1 Tax=Mucilaginibacter yixingensis TaxID=1295612 RepID=A0A2T5J6Z4_9SPHI|nr:ATP-binding protein [Mucilaginibacter yixingensis]PTQ94920.1 light-regulated signal transduction histidine kinase (bacteriophytochrome) [Mucilaginibacter yixingensis]
MQQFQVDLTNCDKEPIHIPGKVQPHGFLVSVSSADLLITYISQNTGHFAGMNAQDLLGKHINELSIALNPTAPAEQLSQLLSVGKHNKSFENINPFGIDINGQAWYIIINPSGNQLVMEFEPAESNLALDVQKVIGRSVTEILSGRNLETLLTNAAAEVKKVIAYDRVMIYRFNDDGHGEVVAEVKNDDLEPFFGLHYPASDIPRQARELYKINLTRIIADVYAEDAPIITYQKDAAPLDLTHSGLRAVSPIHIQYLKNMGVASSFSISLIAHGELWGLIACHNYSPRFINYKARDAAKLIGQLLSSALEYRQDEEDTEKLQQLIAAANTVSGNLKNYGNLQEALVAGKTTIKDITEAAGAAVIFNNTITTIGNTPTDEQIADIATWLQANMSDAIYYTNRFPEIHTAARAYSNTASGIMACSLSKDLSELVIWFKPEQLTSISWAGKPDKPVEKGEDGLLYLNPRQSFEAWTEIVKHTSDRWSNEEVSAVVKIREEIIYAINRKANEIRLLNERLQLAYEELDTFSYTISHDLRTPLSSIKSYSEFLLQSNTSLDDNARRILGRVVNGADKMNLLIQEILNYTRVGRADVKYNKIDMAALLKEITGEVMNALNPPNLKLVIGDTPNIYGDQIMITQVFTNLINNAVKYSSRANPGLVEVKGVVEHNETIYSVSDNGVGIDVNYFSRVFELFKRMDNVKDFDGTGVGLAIVKRIVEKHQARIWFDSKLKVGTVFYVAFRNL